MNAETPAVRSRHLSVAAPRAKAGEAIEAKDPVVPAPPDPGPELPLDRFLDREGSWLAFNERVLELAEDPATPLLERARFLAIFASNLDEFFMVRVAGLKRRIATGLAVKAASGLQPRQVLENIWSRSRALMARHATCLHHDILPALGESGIELLRFDDLTDGERQSL